MDDGAFTVYSSQRKDPLLYTYEVSDQEEHDRDMFYRIARMHGVVDFLYLIQAFAPTTAEDYQKLIDAMAMHTQKAIGDTMVDNEFNNIAKEF